MPRLLCNAFLSIFTVCLLGPYPHHLGNEEEKEKKRGEEKEEEDLKSSDTVYKLVL